MSTLKPAHLLTPEDFESYPVWEYDLEHEGDDEQDETWVRPVEAYPVDDLDNCVLGSTVVLANGSRMPASFANISLNNERSTREFLTLSLWYQGEWIDLARYFDEDNEERGPTNLCRQLGLTIHDVFPIIYDISNIASGLESVTRGQIEAEPQHRLTDEERMNIIFD